MSQYIRGPSYENVCLRDKNLKTWENQKFEKRKIART